MEKVKRINAPVGRVKCYAEFCKYYATGDLCMAQNIEIRPSGGGSKAVNCATFIESKE
jgi:hypothetical protein